MRIQKKYEPSRNDEILNTHNCETLIIWRANIDWKKTLSNFMVINDIEKYVAKP